MSLFWSLMLRVQSCTSVSTVFTVIHLWVSFYQLTDVGLPTHSSGHTLLVSVALGVCLFSVLNCGVTMSLSGNLKRLISHWSWVHSPLINFNTAFFNCLCFFTFHVTLRFSMMWFTFSCTHPTAGHAISATVPSLSWLGIHWVHFGLFDCLLGTAQRPTRRVVSVRSQGDLHVRWIA